ncbi:hypothetical protein D3C84_1105310 [compost metagenome]
MVDGIGHGCRHPDDADFAHPLGAQGIDDLVVFFDEQYVNVADVGVYRDVIFGQAVIHVAA